MEELKSDINYWQLKNNDKDITLQLFHSSSLRMIRGESRTQYSVRAYDLIYQ